jgi:hypothetical protein
MEEKKKKKTIRESIVYEGSGNGQEKTKEQLATGTCFIQLCCIHVIKKIEDTLREAKGTPELRVDSEANKSRLVLYYNVK